jgi:hypothetical protein
MVPCGSREGAEGEQRQANERIVAETKPPIREPAQT